MPSVITCALRNLVNARPISEISARFDVFRLPASIPPDGHAMLKMVEVPVNDAAPAILVRECDSLGNVTGATYVESSSDIPAPQEFKSFADTWTIGYVRVGVGTSNLDVYVRVDYRGKGSIVSAEDINELATGALIKDNAVATRHLPTDFTVKQNLVIPGNLTVTGNIDLDGVLNSVISSRIEELKVKDLRIFLNEDGGAIATGEDSGLFINRGGTDTIPDSSMFWHEDGVSSYWLFNGTDDLLLSTKPLLKIGNDHTLKFYGASGGEIFSLDATGNLMLSGAISFSGSVLFPPSYTSVLEPAPTLAMIGGIYYQSDDRQFKGVASDGLGGAIRVILG